MNSNPQSPELEMPIRDITNNSTVDSRSHGLPMRRELPTKSKYSLNISLKLPLNSDAIRNALNKLLPTNGRTSELLCQNADAELEPGKSKKLTSMSSLLPRTFMEISKTSAKLITLPSKVLSSDSTCEMIELA